MYFIFSIFLDFLMVVSSRLPLNLWCAEVILVNIKIYIDGLVQDRSISIASTLEILQSCPKPSSHVVYLQFLWFFKTVLVQVVEIHSCQRQGTCLLCIINAIVADDLVTQGARSSEDLSKLPQNIPLKAFSMRRVKFQTDMLSFIDFGRLTSCNVVQIILPIYF